MKAFFASAAAALLAGAQASTPVCDPFTDPVTSIIAASAGECLQDTGLVLFTGYPTEEQQELLCSCENTIADLMALDLVYTIPDCMIQFDGVQTTLDDYLTEVFGECPAVWDILEQWVEGGERRHKKRHHKKHHHHKHHDKQICDIENDPVLSAVAFSSGKCAADTGLVLFSGYPTEEENALLCECQETIEDLMAIDAVYSLPDCWVEVDGQLTTVDEYLTEVFIGCPAVWEILDEWVGDAEPTPALRREPEPRKRHHKKHHDKQICDIENDPVLSAVAFSSGKCAADTGLVLFSGYPTEEENALLCECQETIEDLMAIDAVYSLPDCWVEVDGQLTTVDEYLTEVFIGCPAVWEILDEWVGDN